MSFSGDVKEELSKQLPKARHCQIAELGAIVGMCGNVEGNSDEGYKITIQTENARLARKCFTLIKKTFKIITEIEIENGSGQFKGRRFIIRISSPEDALNVLQAFKEIGEDGNYRPPEGLVPKVLVLNDCCRRAFLRGAFMAGGSMSDPEKSYHLEFICDKSGRADQLVEQMKAFGIDAKVVERKNHYIAYIKEGTQIIDLLNVMEAFVALMQMENVRILKDMRNNVNRQVNCETANLNKTVSAAVKQIEDIKFLINCGELDKMPEHLKEMAHLRLEHPESSLKELGEMCDPKVGKSGVNHRLKKLSETAENIRG
ncbi:MAG: DNA-binding protein WhiA [Eubacterium sp.]|nr:DNA-binding protein WhiA [Eubacterium sp.]